MFAADVLTVFILVSPAKMTLHYNNNKDSTGL